MKKSVLLATIANCLLGANAIAGGSIATDKQSATINVHANIRIADELKSLQDMNFGTLHIVSGTSGDLVSIDTSGARTVKNDGVVHVSGKPQAAFVTDGTGNIQDKSLSITCANGISNSVTNNTCDLGDGLSLKDIKYLSKSGKHWLGGTLTATKAIKENKRIDATEIKITFIY